MNKANKYPLKITVVIMLMSLIFALIPWGIFAMHLYSERGIIAGTSFVVDSLPTKNIIKAEVSENCTTMEISLLNVDDYDKVFFPTWSNVNGQDDIAWYIGEKNADGTWSADADLRNHNSAGYYTIHAYGEKNGVITLLINTYAYVASAA